jgi:hypothetical protein
MAVPPHTREIRRRHSFSCPPDQPEVTC